MNGGIEMKTDTLCEILREYPYLIDKAFVRSRSEAEKVIQDKNFPSCEAFIERAKSNSKLPPTAWKAFDQALERYNKSH